MGIAGEEGVRHVMKSLLADFDILYVLCPASVSGHRKLNVLLQDECRRIQQYLRDQSQRAKSVEAVTQFSKTIG